MIKVERNVPRTAKRRANKYPFADLKIGDSFYVPNVKSINGSVAWAQLRLGIKLSTQREGKGLRVRREA